MNADSSKITVYGKPECTDFLRSKEVLHKRSVDFSFVNILESSEAAEEAERISGGKSSPVIVFADGSFQVEPTDSALEEKLHQIDAV